MAVEPTEVAGADSSKSYGAAASLVLQFLGNLFGGGEETAGGFEPTDVFNRIRQLLPEEGEDEAGLARLQQDLYRSLAQQARGPMPQELGLGALARGELSTATRGRIHQTAFGGMQEGIHQGLMQAQQMAARRGMSMSSMEGVAGAQLTRPLMAQAAQMQAGLELNEMNRLMGLRQQAMANRIAIQNSPALERLLRIRMAEQETNQISMGRHPDGLPDWAYGAMGASGGTGAPAWDPAYGVREGPTITYPDPRDPSGGNRIDIGGRG